MALRATIGLQSLMSLRPPCGQKLGPASTWFATGEECCKRFTDVRKKKNPTGGADSHDAQKAQVSIFKDIYAEIRLSEVRVLAM